ncbi:DNA polymerase III polC-type [hydrothermal vent metagenome]|uniref:DNA polymerase III polC-type n=1 Tax=hydrothermal vent metagenome TaxID=652676 RepID=A0A3B1AJ92_9ZZZZ
MEQDLIKQLEDTGNYHVIKRFEPVEFYHQVANPDSNIELRKCIFLDVETTGLSHNEDTVIELAMVPFEYDADGNIYNVLPAYNGFQDPGRPIPVKITELTGITDDMVKGQSLDMVKITEMLSDCVLVIAHNARFDRPFMEAVSDEFKEKYWACSIADVDWSAEGFGSSKLEFLAYQFKFFYEAHRAVIDCQIGIHILTQTLPKSGANAMQLLLSSARRTDFRLWAKGAPFDKKDELRKRGYRWANGDDGGFKAWYLDLPESELDTEYDYLSEYIFNRTISNLPTKKLTGKLRYSSRI